MECMPRYHPSMGCKINFVRLSCSYQPVVEQECCSLAAAVHTHGIVLSHLAVHNLNSLFCSWNSMHAPGHGLQTSGQKCNSACSEALSMHTEVVLRGQYTLRQIWQRQEKDDGKGAAATLLLHLHLLGLCYCQGIRCFHTSIISQAWQALGKPRTVWLACLAGLMLLVVMVMHHHCNALLQCICLHMPPYHQAIL